MPKREKKRKLDSPLHAVLVEAEETHYRNCPNAELSIRMAAFILDAILVYLAWTGMQHLFEALSVHLGHLGTSPWFSWIPKTTGESLSKNSGQIAAHLLMLSRLGFLYFYSVWATVFSGGTPGKLLLGIRVLDEKNGKNLSLAQAMGIFVVSVMTFGFGFSLAFLRKDKRAVHDLIAGSVVKKIHGAR